MILLLLFIPVSSFAYHGSSLSNKIIKPNTSLNTKTKPTHTISITLYCDAGAIKSISVVILQANGKNHVERNIDQSPKNHTSITQNLPDGVYMVTASSRIMTSGGPVNAEGHVVFTVNGKDQTFSIKLEPFEGMA